MRLLISCTECNRQYDATGREPGDRFRCHCGAAATVREHAGHDASVVRCSSCGAPRESGAASCRFCAADFTLHERDLDTVCPRCFARVSDRARFCHHCGTMLTPEAVPGEKTSLVCPGCEGHRHLESRMVAGVAVLECHGCAGLWLSNAAFSQLTHRALNRAEAVDSLLAPSPGTEPAKVPLQEGPWRYRRCPECGTLMNRRNYGPGSGVIIDVCREHGLWFDPEELPTILDWIRRGGQAQAEQDRIAERARAERHRQALATRSVGGGLERERTLFDGPALDFGGMLTELARRLFS